MNMKINSIYSLFDDSMQCIDNLGSKFTTHRKRLDELEKRLQVGRFHLAVLGQFKRGKSTLKEQKHEKRYAPH